MAEGLLPTYSTAGHLAPAIFLVARIASGVSLGGEFTGTAVMESWGWRVPFFAGSLIGLVGTQHSRSRSGNTPLREIAEQGKNGPDTFARESKRPTAPSFSHSR